MRADDLRSAARRRPAVDVLGRHAYDAWTQELSGESTEPWEGLPGEVRDLFTTAATAAFQLGENHGVTLALDATLPAGQLGAAGEIQNLADAIHLHFPADRVQEPVLSATQFIRQMLTETVKRLRREAAAERSRQ